jgi:lipoprotein Spr
MNRQNYKFWSMFLLLTISLSACLTRKNALPPDRVPTAQRTESNKKEKRVAKKVDSHPKKSERSQRLSLNTDAKDKKAFHMDPSLPIHEQYAEWLGVSVRQIESKKLYQEFHSWMGVPHRDGGNNRSGIDCSGFVKHIFNEVYGIQTPRSAQEMSDQVKQVKQAQLKEGDLVFFSFGKRKIDHVGIYLHQHKFVHVSSSKGVIVSDLRDAWYASYLVKSGSIK